MKTPRIILCASFTAESIEPSIRYWIQQLQLSYDVEFTAYNQVFQQLLDADGPFSRNKGGINVILIRFEDWLRYETSIKDGSVPMTEINQKIEQNNIDLISALKSSVSSSRIPHLVCICPPSPETKFFHLFNKMEEFLTFELKQIPGLYIIGGDELRNKFPGKNYYDSNSDEIAHIPFTPVFFTALGTLIAQKIYGLNRPPYKAIVLDCDHTLWKGVCAEESVSEIEVNTSHIDLQQFIIQQYDKGMLICLCSKNNEHDVFSIFDEHSKMLLKREHIISYRINWEPKSANIKSLADELNLALHSIVFIDDNPVECAEVQANCPEVLTLQLPDNLVEFVDFLKNIWIFDQLKVTAEDKNRTLLYQQNSQREQFREESFSLAEFIEGLELEIVFSEPAAHQFSRVSQLTQRTSQFNFTSIKRSESEIYRLFDSKELSCQVVHVKDRFGDYGLVGVVLFRENRGNVEVDTLLLSCRVLGRGVEYLMLRKLGEIAQESSLQHVIVKYIPTKRNKPVLDFLNTIGMKFKQDSNTNYVFNFPTEFLLQLKNKPDSTAPEQIKEVVFLLDGVETQRGVSESKLIQDIVREHNDVEQIHEQVKEFQKGFLRQNNEIPSEKNSSNPEAEKLFIPPDTVIEEVVAEIWEEVIGMGRIGIEENFFMLGGHSLQAVQIISRIRETIGIELNIQQFFEKPTILELAAGIESSLKHLIGEQGFNNFLSEINTLSGDEAGALIENRIKGSEIRKQ